MPETARIVEGAIPVPLLEARRLTYGAGGQPLIDGLDLRIAPGRRTVILGANGAGKSLTLRLLHGLIAPDAGEVLWHGHPLDRRARFAQALVFQKPVLLRRSVVANLRFALAARGVRGAEARARVDEALARARLGDLVHRPARVLSGGEQQRLAIARALACRPEVLFLDEPTASLDPGSTAAVEGLIERAHSDGITIVLVTHDQGQARRLAEDAVFLHNGRVAEAGPAAQVLDRPRTPAAQAWLEGRLYLESEVSR